MKYRVTLIPGDGIGPEVTGATTEILAAAGAPIEWERVDAGMSAFNACGDALPEAVVSSIRNNRVGLKGPLSVLRKAGASEVQTSDCVKHSICIPAGDPYSHFLGFAPPIQT